MAALPNTDLPVEILKHRAPTCALTGSARLAQRRIMKQFYSIAWGDGKERPPELMPERPLQSGGRQLSQRAARRDIRHRRTQQRRQRNWYSCGGLIVLVIEHEVRWAAADAAVSASAHRRFACQLGMRPLAVHIRTALRFTPRNSATDSLPPRRPIMGTDSCVASMHSVHPWQDFLFMAG